MVDFAAILAGTALAASTFSSFRAASAQEEAIETKAAGDFEQIELIKKAAEIEAVADVESATALREKTDFDFKTIDRRENEILSAVKFNEEQHVKNTELLRRQGQIAIAQKHREVAKAVGATKARAAGAGVYASGGASAEVAKDTAITGDLERARINLQIAQAQQQLDDQIGQSRINAFVAAENIRADREVLAFNFNVADRQRDLAIQIHDIEREAKISSLAAGAQAAQAGAPSPGLSAFTTAMTGLAKLNRD